MRSAIQIATAVFAIIAACVARADDVTLESSPPVVVKTIPQAGTSDVDPKLSEIKVTFSKPMMDKSWSSTTISKDSFPEVAGQPKYLDDKCTFVLPVNLAPGKTYAILLNSEQFKNFKDADGRSAMPYLLVFKTIGEAAGGPASNDRAALPLWTEEFASRAFDRLWNEMDQKYSYFSIKQDVDWPALKEKYRPLAAKAKNPLELVEALSPMLASLRDLHVWIESPGGQKHPFGNSYSYNGNRDAIRAILKNESPCGRFAVVAKTKPDGFGYFLMVNQGSADDASVETANGAIENLRDAPGFIVDLRQANGGDERLAQRIARLFCAKDAVYAKSKYRNGPDHADFTEAYSRTLEAVANPYTKPVVCLIGPGAVSSGEGFVKMMKCLPHVTTVGLPTRGSSGKPEPFELPGTSVTVWFSRWVDLLPSGESFEGRGIPPDMKVDVTRDAGSGRDPTLERGLSILREKVASAKVANH